MSMRRSAAPELSEAARARLDALRRDLVLEAGAGRTRTDPSPDPSPGHVDEQPTGRPVDDPAPAAPSIPAPPGQAGHMPVPGRHATARPRPSPAWVDALADRLPAGWGDRPLGVAHVAVVAVLAAVAIAGGAWWALQVQTDATSATSATSATPVAPAAGVASSDDAASAPGTDASLVELPAVADGADPGSPTTGGAARAGTNPLTVVVVDVAGKVRRPGLATLPEGARVADAIEAAGGARRGVSLISLNLARVLVDGEQVLVGVRAAAGAGSVAATGGVVSPSAGGSVLVDLNTADTATLETLPGVGPVTAAAIIAWRDEHGGFSAVTELLEVSGIGPATLEELAPHVTV